jgi:hypothetical protein
MYSSSPKWGEIASFIALAFVGGQGRFEWFSLPDPVGREARYHLADGDIEVVQE